MVADATIREVVLNEISEERTNQQRKWGDDHDDDHAPLEWGAILTDRIGKLAHVAVNSGAMISFNPTIHNLYRRRLIEIAAVAVAALEADARATYSRQGK